MATVTTNDNVIISRIQQRRGLKQDLPQPLRSGEFGFATDSKQLYIGGELSATSNISVAETTTSALAHSVSISNTRIIHFTVPHKRFPIGTYDGVTTSSSWGITTETFSGSGKTVFLLEFVLNHMSQGTRVFVVEMGRGFEKAKKPEKDRRRDAARSQDLDFGGGDGGSDKQA